MKVAICNGESETAKLTAVSWMMRVSDRLSRMDLSYLPPDDRDRVMWEKAMVHVRAFQEGKVSVP